jgi:hypothetical protein
LLENFEKQQKYLSELALWKISGVTAKFRAAGVKRVFGRYDGGGDESFTHYRGIEMSDGRVISAAESIGEKIGAQEIGQLIEDAASALLGSFDAGEFVVRGALAIDFEACTITDERNVDVVFDG